MNYRSLFTSLFTLLTPIVLLGQSISGNVSDESQPLVGANIVVVGTDMGAVSVGDGSFMIDNVPAGEYDVKASFIGYSTVTKTVTVGEENVGIDFVLEVDAVTLSALEVLASRADETTPVAYTNVSKEEMEIRLGSQDIPMILNTTPSVYALSLIHI